MAVLVFTVSSFPFPSLIATFLISGTKIPDEKQIKREGAYSYLCFEVPLHCGGDGMVAGK